MLCTENVMYKEYVYRSASVSSIFTTTEVFVFFLFKLFFFFFACQFDEAGKMKLEKKTKLKLKTIEKID